MKEGICKRLLGYDKDIVEIIQFGGVCTRTAFNSLFHAARIAAMSYLATENARWGGIKRRLPQLYRAEFEEFFNTLHIL